VTTLTAGLAAPTVAGDDIYIAVDHTETNATATTYLSLGTATLPCRIFVADHTVALVGGTPPASALVHTPTVTIGTTLASNLTMTGVVSHCEGIIFSAGSGANIAHAIFTGQWNLKNCNVFLSNTSVTSAVRATGSNVTRTTWDNVSISFAVVNQGIATQGGEFLWKNSVALHASSLTPSLGLFGASGYGNVTLRGVDLTNVTAARNLVGGSFSVSFSLTLIGCKEPAGWASANRFGTQIGDFVTVIGDRVDSGAINYTKYKEDFFGTQITDASVTRTGGATDGTTPTSWKIDTSTKAKAKPNRPFRSTPLVIWNDVTGTNRVVTVYGRAAALPVDADIWLEIDYMGSSASPLSTISVTSPVTSDASAWSGSTTSFKMTATLSAPQPAMKGPITIRVCVGGQSIYYIDWQPVLS
jgi:hypothetical protein